MAAVSVSKVVNRRVATSDGHEQEHINDCQSIRKGVAAMRINSPSPHHRPTEAQMGIFSDTTLSSGSTGQRQTSVLTYTSTQFWLLRQS